MPKGTNWFYTLGSATLFAFAMQALTGVFLAMYYVPSSIEAYNSITHLTNDVFLGEFVRGLHKWGATLMIVLIFLHMGRTFFFGAYKYPRELNWVIGVVLLILTLVMGLTGYLLPFDQRSYWATIVAMNITGSGPVARPLPRRLPARRLRVRRHDAAAVLRRPHAPGAGADHRPDRRPPVPRGEARDDGASVAARRPEAEGRCARRRWVNSAEKEAYLREYEILKKKGKPFFPYAVFKDSAMFLVVALVMIAMALILGAEQGPKADPTTTTYVPRPEWYFFFLFELLRVIKPPELVPIATVGIPTLCMVLLLLLPFYDRNPERVPWRRPVATTAGIMTIIAMAFLTYLGASAGSPTEIDLEVPPQFEAGQAGRGPVGLPRLPQVRRERQRRPGPGADRDRREAARLQAIARSLINRPPRRCPRTRSLPPEKFDNLVKFLASLQ